MDPETGRDLAAAAARDRTARRLVTVDLARQLVAGGKTVPEAARAVRGVWDFDEVIYRDLDEPLCELVRMAWWHEADTYEESGGDARFLRAAEVLAIPDIDQNRKPRI